MATQRQSRIFTGLWIAASLAMATACTQTPPRTAQSEQVLPSRTQAAQFEADRKAILAMAGNYKVSFDFQETVALQEGYTLKDRYQTGGHEVVRVIEDRGDFISLQHILVATANGQSFPVKHWRQDWAYEPDTVLTYIGNNAWKRKNVSPAARAGAWSQTVYQVDDAPRYGALARWSHDAGVSQWAADATWRPLPRRDATKRTDYNVMDAANRHVITPWGWVHEQDNGKLQTGATPQLLAREIGVNTYRRDDDFPVSVAETYWTKTKAYWAEVRSAWEEIARQNEAFGLTIQGEPEALYMQILGLAEAVSEGEETAASAGVLADAIIEDFTTLNVAALTQE